MISTKEDSTNFCHLHQYIKQHYQEVEADDNKFEKKKKKGN